jgi:hypothetical protein
MSTSSPRTALARRSGIGDERVGRPAGEGQGLHRPLSRAAPARIQTMLEAAVG